MFGSGVLQFTENRRGISLLLGFAVVLLVWVSVTVAQAADPARLLVGLKRDLGALRAQLEQLDPWYKESPHQGAAFNADLGDGGPAFRRQSLTTIGRAANRRVERLIEAYYRIEALPRARAAQPLRFAMYELQSQIERLGHATTPPAAIEARTRIEALLDQSERMLDHLIAASAEATIVAQRARVGPGDLSSIAPAAPAP